MSGGALAGAAQENTPTTPGGGEQPDPDEPTSDDDPATPEPGEEPAPVEPAPGAEGIAEDDGALGFLPSTGLEAAALGAIGFGLLLAGIALRPRRRVAASSRR